MHKLIRKAQAGTNTGSFWTNSSVNNSAMNTANMFNTSGLSQPKFNLVSGASNYNNQLIGDTSNLSFTSNGSFTSSGGFSSTKTKIDPNVSGAVTGYLAGQLGNVVGNAVGGDAGTIVSGATSNLASSLSNTALAGGTVKEGLKAFTSAGNLANLGAGIGTALLDKYTAHSRYSGKEANTAMMTDMGAGAASLGAGLLGASGGMGALGGLGMAVTNYLTGGTDGMTKTDSLLGSSSLAGALTMIPGVGPWAAAGYIALSGINSALGKTTTKNANTDFYSREKLGDLWGSYGKSEKDHNNALQYGGKKYGALSRGAYKKAEKRVLADNERTNTLLDIHSKNEIANVRGQNMIDMNNLQYYSDLNGGYSQRLNRIGRSGMKFPTLQEVRQVLSKKSGGNLLPPKPELLEILSEDPEIEEVPEFKKGGSTTIKEKNDESYQEFLKSLPKNLQEQGISEDGYRMRYAFDNSPDVWTFEDAKGKFINWNYEDNSWHGSTVFGPTGEFLKSSSHPSTYMEVQWYKDHPGADNFRKKYKLVTTDEKGDPLKYIKYITRNPEELDLFRDGGSIIPAGALHKCKNHMELAKEGKITHKGIPVVTTDGSNEQQAEIECNEIIYQKSITQQLEQLMKKYYSDEYTQKEKDEFAIEAGKLLVVETLENTEDHTGLIASIESELPID